MALTNRLLATVTALLLFAGSGGTAQDYSVAQLEEIERLILSKDLGALWRFLQLHPEFAQGNDPLAQELRLLMAELERGVIGPLAYRAFGSSISESESQNTETNDLGVPISVDPDY